MHERVYLSSLAEAVTSQDHMEGKLADHRVAHIDKAVSGLLQQQRTAQVRVLGDGNMRGLRLFNWFKTQGQLSCVYLYRCQSKRNEK